jgi:hypothetical protein
VIQPLLDLCEPQLAESDASEHCGVRASHTPRIWELTRQTSRQQIKDAGFFFVEFFPLIQSFTSDC